MIIINLIQQNMREIENLIFILTRIENSKYLLKNNVKEIIKEYEPQVSSSGAYDTRRSFRVMQLFDETTDAAICARDFDANALIHLALGFNETQDPSYIHEVEINNNTIDNTFSSDVFAFAPVTGANIHEGNKVFFSTNNNDFAANKTFKFFHKKQEQPVSVFPQI